MDTKKRKNLLREETKTATETPLMKQYYSIKAKYPDALLLFRVGDFYETFGEDAVKASGILGIVLTRRANGSAAFVELAGFPHHSLDSYLPRLVRAGLRVAVCDQLEDPKLTKKIVRRGVTELISPGVAFSDKIIDHKKNNFLASVFPDGRQTGVAFIDISTGEFFAAQGDAAYVDKLIQNYQPCEIIFSRAHRQNLLPTIEGRYPYYCLDEWVFREIYAREILTRHFSTKSLKGFGIDDFTSGIIAAGAALHYVSDTRQDHLAHISSISRIVEDDFVWLDRFTIRNLELVAPSAAESVCLADIIDNTLTPMGGRLLRRWIMQPLKNPEAISSRQDIVGYMLSHPGFSEILSGHLRQTGDLVRIISRTALGKISPRELQQLNRSLATAELIAQACTNADHPALNAIGETTDSCPELRSRITACLHDDPPALLAKGGVIATGYNEELDELRNIALHGKDYLAQLQQREAAATGIPSLKVGFNNVFGYYLEVTHTHKDKVPGTWVRKQTLTNAERYITEELKKYEEKILGAEEKMLALETRLFNELVAFANGFIEPVQQAAQNIAMLDCLHSFATSASRNNYVRPQVNDELIIDIRNGRHPVIEKHLPPGEEFVANDVYLDPTSQQILMITGPNMSGKSAILRQTALIVLLAQTGSYVPAASARIGIVDRIFTRVGASDNISSGESTFMVEMNETAGILHNLSERSLVLLDEIGRGTSTYDGISIAWAIAEYLHEHATSGAKTLFATHYHELNEMANIFPRIRNFHVTVREVDGNILFLRKLVQGGSEHSFGIHVAKMAGVPVKVIQRATEMLKQLESSRSIPGKKTNARQPAEDMQLSFFKLDDPVLEQVREEILKTEIDNLTPVQALNKLAEIKRIIAG